MIQQFFHLVLEIFYPTRCLNCHKEMAEGGVLCPVCRSLLQHERFFPGADYDCKYLDGIFFSYGYKGAIREALLEAKFYYKKSFAQRLAVEQGYMDYGRLADVWQLQENVMVTPIPTDKRRAKARGFDLPEKIFHNWCRKEKLEWQLSLERVKHSEPQFGLTKRQRVDNVRNCWSVCANTAQRQIILVDDIFTTGATMNEAARCLKQAGAAKVYGVALAGGKS